MHNFNSAVYIHTVHRTLRSDTQPRRRKRRYIKSRGGSWRKYRGTITNNTESTSDNKDLTSQNNEFSAFLQSREFYNSQSIVRHEMEKLSKQVGYLQKRFDMVIETNKELVKNLDHSRLTQNHHKRFLLRKPAKTT